MKVTLTKNNIISQSIGLIFVLFSLSDIFQSIELIVVGTILSLLIFLFHFPIKDKNFWPIIILFWIFLITSLINLYFTEYGLGGSFVFFGNLMVTFLYFKADKKKLAKWIILGYLLPLGFIAYRLFVMNIPANEIYEDLSRNHASFTLIFWTIFLLFHLKVTYNFLSIILPFISLIISVFLMGRTSIMVGMALFLMVFIFKFKSKGNIQFLISFFLLLSICYYLWFEYGTLLVMETNLNKGLDTQRWSLWGYYFNNINTVSFFTGVDVTKIPYIHSFDDNVHNSFIKFHSRIGIGSILFLFLYLISFIKYLVNKDVYILGLLIILTTRALFDSDILISKFDFIIFIMIFYSLRRLKNSPAAPRGLTSTADARI